jgi:ribosomal protein S6E (S10)
VSQGLIELGGSSIELITSGPSRQSCPSLKNGEVYTLISTTGTLSGSFSNAPQGEKIVAEYPAGCLKVPFYLEIAYHESEATKTVTAKVIQTDSFELPLPVNPINEYHAPNAEGATWGPISSALAVAEAKAAERKASEEAEARARALADASLGEVSLAGTGIAVQSDGMALVTLGCKGGESCGGKLTLSAQAKSKKKRAITLGTAGFSIAAGKTATVKVKLNVAGRGLLKAVHGRLAAHLTILKLTPVPEHTQITSVRLSEERPRGGKTKK